MGLARIELATSALSVLRSNRLSYSPNWYFVPVRLPPAYAWATTPAIVRPQRTWSGHDGGAAEGLPYTAPESVRRSRPRQRQTDPGAPASRGKETAARKEPGELVAAVEGRVVEPNRATVGQLPDRWVDHVQAIGEARPKTVYEYRRTIDGRRRSPGGRRNAHAKGPES